MLRTNEELVTDCGQDLEQVQKKAQSLLLNSKPLDDSDESNHNRRKNLYQTYDETDDALTRSAIAYLLKNRCQIHSYPEEDLEKFLTYRCKIDRTDSQENYIRRLQSTLDRIDRPFDRPSKPLYQGHPNIIVAVSMGLQSPATVIAIDVTSQKILAYRSTKQLLGDNYQLLNRQRNQQMQQRHLRHNSQKQGRSCQLSNSELGEHLDRLFAKAIVELAQTYRAGSIALPQLDQIRSIVQSEIDAQAQRKIPGHIESQKKYAKQLRISLHNWSYNRLAQAIVNKAGHSEIAITSGRLRQRVWL